MKIFPPLKNAKTNPIKPNFNTNYAKTNPIKPNFYTNYAKTNPIKPNFTPKTPLIWAIYTTLTPPIQIKKPSKTALLFWVNNTVISILNFCQFA